MIAERTASRRTATWRYLRWALALPALPLALWACTSKPFQEPDPRPEIQNDQYIEVNPNRDIDIVFLIDDSPSMREEQNSLRQNFPKMMDQLKMIQPGLPNVRIGIVSSDLGAGSQPPKGTNCGTTGGKRGHFVVKPGCNLTEGSRYLISVDNGTKNNFTGDISQVFSCLAELGDQGCGFEHQLSATLAALQDPERMNATFLRDEAYLALVFITDEDDCSADTKTTLFGEDRLGEAQSLRCATEGHTCNGAKPQYREPNGFEAPLTACKPTVGGELLDIEALVNSFRKLKPRPDQQIIASGIFGWPIGQEANKKYQLAKRNGEWDYAHVCEGQGDVGQATAAIRMKAFIDSFGANGSVHNICDGDFGPAMQKIGEKLRVILENTCVSAPVVDRDPGTNFVPECQVSDRRFEGQKPIDTALPACAEGGPRPCWRLVNDKNKCPVSGYNVEVDRAGQMPPQGTQQVIKCLTCATDDPKRCPPAP